MPENSVRSWIQAHCESNDEQGEEDEESELTVDHLMEGILNQEDLANNLQEQGSKRNQVKNGCNSLTYQKYTHQGI